MYAKLFGSILASSIWDQDGDTCKLFITLLVMADREGYIYGSLSGVAHQARLPFEKAEAAMAVLMSPDPRSGDAERAPENQGRRVDRTPAGWLLLNYAFYREMRDAEVRREQLRSAQRRHRAKAVSSNVMTGDDDDRTDDVQSNAIGVIPSDSDSDQMNMNIRMPVRFAPPSLEEVKEFVKAKEYSFDPDVFFAHYEANGWVQASGRPIKRWKAACVTFQKNIPRFGGGAAPAARTTEEAAAALAEARRGD